MTSDDSTYSAANTRSAQAAFATSSAPVSGNARLKPADSETWGDFPSVEISILKSRETGVLIALLIVTFFAHFYAADLKGIWNDDAVRLTIANGGLATASLENRHPGRTADVLRAIGNFAVQPVYPLLVNRILRFTDSYSVIPIVTTNLLIFLFSAVGIRLLARPFLSTWGTFLALLFYLWNGFGMVHVLQAREYPLVLCLFIWNTFFFYWLFETSHRPGRWTFPWVALAHCLTAIAAFYTTSWAPFFLWPQAVIALLFVRRNQRSALAALASLAIAGLSYLPWLLQIPRNSALFLPWDREPRSLTLLLTRLHSGTEYLLVGSQQAGLSLLVVYYWLLIAASAGGVAYFALRFLHQPFQIQHLVLTILGFLAFQIGYFFWREPLATWPRYFILYLPYVALLIPFILSRLMRWLAPSMARRAWLQIMLALLFAAAGVAQIRNNYKNPYVDHGPDFRQVYRYLVTRAAPSDKIVVGLQTNLMALNYYWPTPRQIQIRCVVAPEDRTKAHPNIWVVSYRDEKSLAYQTYAAELDRLGYRLRTTHIVSGVTIRCFQANP